MLLCQILLYGWTPLVLILFARMQPHRALLMGVIAGSLFLPEVQMSASDGAPDASQFVLVILKFTKPNTISFSALLGVMLFDPRRLLTYRLRWFDLPMIVWCLCPFISSLTNELGVYNGLSVVFRQTSEWFLPYLIGRLYFSDFEGLRRLAVGIAIGGLVYVLPCMFEMKMSPVLL